MIRAMRNRWNRYGPLWVLVGACLTGGVAAETLPDLAASYWVPRDALPPEQADALPGFCSGAYRVPEYPHPRTSDPDEFPMHARAGRAAYRMDGDIDLEEGVVLTQGNRTVAAARATLNHETRQGSLEGGVRLQEPGVAAQGSRAELNLDTRAAELEEVQFVMLDSALRGSAQSLNKDETGGMTLGQGSFTRCEPGNRNWLISASSVRVEQDEVFGVARNAVMRVRGVPVFYSPYIRFPVSDARQSGWLFPNLAYSDEDGMDVSLPYYLNLAPNYDATLSPRYVGDRGTGLEGEFRHMADWQETTLSGAYLHKDDLYNGEFQRDDYAVLLAAGQVTGPFEPADRWLYGIDHSGGFGRFSTRVDYTAVSDRDYFRDLGTDLGVSSQIELERRGEVQYLAGGLTVRLWAQRFQRLDEGQIDPYQRLPELELSYDGKLLGPLEWSLGAEYVSFDRNNDDLGGTAAVVGDRVHLEPRVRLPLAAPWGFLTLTGGYRHTEYDLRDVPVGADAKPDRGVGFGSVRTGLFFERDLDWFGTELVQTLEPEVFYLYQQFEDQSSLPSFDATELTFSYSQLFRDNRFSGVDRIGDANHAAMGITTRFVDKSNGREYLRASLGEIVYFEDREVTLSGAPAASEQQSTSALAGELSASIAASWHLTGTLVWDPHDDQLDEAAGAIQYRRDNRHIVNVGFRKRLEGEIDQTDLSAYWPVSRHFALLGRWNYDVESGRTIEGFGGIEYNDCCWQIRLMARRFLDSPTGRDLDTVEADEGMFLQIVFKGLAGFGTKVESVLERGIRGYQTETNHGY